jgi:hypothetical protein
MKLAAGEPPDRSMDDLRPGRSRGDPGGGIHGSGSCQGLGSWNRYELRRSLGAPRTARRAFSSSSPASTSRSRRVRPAGSCARRRARSGTAAASAGMRPDERANYAPRRHEHLCLRLADRSEAGLEQPAAWDRRDHDADRGVALTTRGRVGRLARRAATGRQAGRCGSDRPTLAARPAAARVGT